MPRPSPPPIGEEDVQGGKYLKPFARLLEKLRGRAEAETESSNRKLKFDHYVGLLLLYFYTPVVTSLRSIQRASQLKNVQRMLRCSRASLGSLSEAASVFDPAILRDVIRELASELTTSKTVPKGLEGLTAVDGSLLRALPGMVWALWRRDEKNRAAKMHLVFDVACEAPVDVTVTHANASEKQQLRSMLEAGRLYVLDRGYAQYKLFADIIAAGSSFICRIRDDAVLSPVEERPLSEEARAAGVMRDQVVRLGGPDTAKDLDRSVRVIKFLRPRTRQDEDPEPILVATDRLDLDAELVALGYRYRWSVELFFRWFKCILGCRHLLSHSQEGVTLQVYMGVIASLLISVWIGRKPTKATLEMVWFYMTGMADEDELDSHLQGLEKHNKS